MDRCSAGFERLLEPHLLDAVERHAGTVYGMWPDFRLAYFNPAWSWFAQENGSDPAIASEDYLGTITPEVLNLLRYRAGPRALERLRRDGLGAGSVRAVVGPASGPRWLALAGLDRALLSTDLLTPTRIHAASPARRILLAGASAGAWRMVAFACRDPRGAHQRLLDGYIDQVFGKSDTPADVSRAYRTLLAKVIADDAGHILDHPVFDLAIHAARCRAGGSRAALLASLLAAGALNTVTARATGACFERVLFHTRPARLPPQFNGRLVTLERRNLLAAARASGTVPLYLEAVRDVPGAPAGAYVDGGLTDYHLRAVWGEDDGLVLLPHYQRTILPRWLDRYRSPLAPLRGDASRRPSPAATADLLQIYPSAEFVGALPGGYIPDRDDFKRFANDPQERIRRWRQVVAASETLGEQLLADLKSGRVVDRVRPL